jgi:NADP-dependent 3-hydroxy acid dehydrogenase YdfG
MDIKDKVVLVAGAPSGIGKATAELFSKKGARVVLATRSPEEVKELAAKIPDSLVVAVDMTKPGEVQQMVQQTQAYFGRIDILINHAGQEMNTPYESFTIENLSRYLASDVYGPLVVMQTTIPLMKQQGGGAIVNISSGVFQSTQSDKPWVATEKTGTSINSLNTRTEYTDHGISVSHVYPRETEADIHRRSNWFKRIYSRKQTNTSHSDSPEILAAKIVETVEKGIDVEFL